MLFLIVKFKSKYIIIIFNENNNFKRVIFKSKDIILIFSKKIYFEKIIKIIIFKNNSDMFSAHKTIFVFEKQWLK